MRVAVLGAGLQGSCVALELARHGVEVDLLDRAETPMAGASSRNEGKIHLGYVYANDPTRRTARTMIEGALEFGPLLRRWLGAGLDGVVLAEPFRYVVHRDSLLDVAEVERHFADCTTIVRELLDGREPDYLGGDPRVPPRRLGDDEVAATFDRDTVLAAYATSELAVEPAVARGRGRPRTERERADPAAAGHRGARRVPARRRRDRAHRPRPTGATTTWSTRSGTAGSSIDETAGLPAARPWLYRMKYFLRLRPTAPLPSTTIMLGPFGDVVTYADGSAFLSWYPAGRLGTSADRRPPDWPAELAGVPAKEVRAGILEGLAEVVPGVGAIRGTDLDDSRVSAA